MTENVSELFSTRTTRERARRLLSRARSGASGHFVVRDSALDATAELVARVTRERYPSLEVPYCSRWRHFEAGGNQGSINRRAWLGTMANEPHTLIDLVVVSVLLGAEAGAQWHYKEARTGQTFSRSEGLGIASFHAFTGGLFSSDPAQPLRCDAIALQRVSALQLGQALQVSDSNPLVGLEGRAHLLRRLGKAMADQGDVFGRPARRAV